MNKALTLTLTAALALAGAAGIADAQNLKDGFQNPPSSAKPFTWWHWMNGHSSKEGITGDLEAMAKAGVGGVQAFNISIVSPGKYGYGTDEWYDLMNHAIKEADRLGIEFDMHNCPGWSSTGGAWITNEHAGKELSWSEAFVKGGKVDVMLPTPSSRLGSYWDDIVIAYPSPKNDAIIENYLVKATVDGVNTDPKLISMNSGRDNTIKFSNEVLLELSQNVRAQTLIGFIKNKPIEIPESQLAQIRQGMGSAPSQPAPTVSFSLDGQTWTNPMNISILADAVSYASFNETEFKYVKIAAKSEIWLDGLQIEGAPMNTSFLRNADFAMSAGGGMGFGPMGGMGAAQAPKAIGVDYAIDPKTVVDITKYMSKDGHLVWDAPAGEWTIIRLGYIPIDRHTKVGSTVGDGLEADKYSAEAIKFHWDNVFPKMMANLEKISKTAGAGILIDSYEAGNANWTPKMRAEFKKYRGYDMTGYIPALIGKYVLDADKTDRFLWDFRRTCADLFADNYAGTLAKLCHEHGFYLYVEPYNSSVFDEMQVGSRVDIPMGEFWVRTHQDRSSLKMASSIAHVNGMRVNGNQIVGAESFTGWQPDAGYQNFPYSLKAQGDDAYTQGLNRFIFHRFVQQPNNYATPGMSMGNIGFHFDRNNTWFEMGSQWLKYVARCQYLLQQGVSVGDVMYLVSEEVPGGSHSAWNPALPAGYSGDAVNAEMFLQKVSINGAELVAQEGLKYRLLMFQNVQGRKMTIGVLRKIEKYVDAGGSVMGFAPTTTPNLSSDAELAEFAQIVKKLWGGIENGGTKKVGKGTVYATNDPQVALDGVGITPDIEYSYAEDAPLNYIHRNVNGTDVYFVANHRRTAENAVITFRVNNRRPELWNADSGEIIPMNTYDVLPDGRVRAQIQFDPVGSWFVVFNEPASGDRIVSVTKDGEDVIRTQTYAIRTGGLYPDVHDNFTISVWIRPESNSGVDNNLGVRGASTWGSNVASYPYVLGDPEALYGKDHTIAGIVSTRMGVSIMERNRKEAPVQGPQRQAAPGGMPGGMGGFGRGGNATAVASAMDRLSSWNHVAAVYENGVPHLYVNGELKATGKAGIGTVHPTYKDVAVANNNMFFEGDFDQYKVIDHAWSADEVKAEFSKGQPKSLTTIAPVKYANGAFAYFENGTYTLTKADGTSSTVTVKGLAEAKDLTSNGWKVKFQEGRGAPESITLDALMPLQNHPDAGVKYFSGTATYSTTFTLSKKELKGKSLLLDLGQVYVIARVKLNGQDLGIVWKNPYMLDITSVAVAGANTLEIEVANLWTNRLIGDAQVPNPYGASNGDLGQFPEWFENGQPKPDDGRVAFSIVDFYDKSEPLYDSGLVGPVVIRQVTIK